MSQTIAGYPVVAPLLPESSYLAEGPGGRQVVLKVLESDCLLGHQLHPAIRQRLARVSEFAHGGVANLHGARREGDQVFLVWEYVSGTVWAEWVKQPGIGRRVVLLMARELVVAVEALHAQGLVHGAIHGHNVIIDERGRLKLTHVSPLLYSETEQDLRAVEKLIREGLGKEGLAETSLSLRELGARLAGLIDV